MNDRKHLNDELVYSRRRWREISLDSVFSMERFAVFFWELQDHIGASQLHAANDIVTIDLKALY